MTYRERLEIENPFLDKAEIMQVIRERCPEDYGFEERTTGCIVENPRIPQDCYLCWGREEQ